MNTLSFYLLSAEESLTTSTRISEIIKQGLNEDAFANILLPKITNATAQLSEAIGRNKKQTYTQQLNVNDEARDKAFIGFRDYVKAFTHLPDPTKQSAAYQLYEIISQVGWSLYGEGYVAESALLNALFTELDKGEHQQAIETIGALEWYQNLKESNATFESTYRLKVESEAERETTMVGEIKRDLAKFINPLIDYIYLNAELIEGNFSTVAGQLDELISSVMSIARARQTRKENATAIE